MLSPVSANLSLATTSVNNDESTQKPYTDLNLTNNITNSYHTLKNSASANKAVVTTLEKNYGDIKINVDIATCLRNSIIEIPDQDYRNGNIGDSDKTNIISNKKTKDIITGSAEAYRELKGGADVEQSSRSRRETESLVDAHNKQKNNLSECFYKNEDVAHSPERILSKNDLMPGDILLLKDEKRETLIHKIIHKIITLGQRIAGLSLRRNNKGEANLVHALLWTKNPLNYPNLAPESAGEPEISECRGGKRLCIQNTALRKGIYKVYRPDNSNMGSWGAQIAMMWGDKRNIKYNIIASMLSIFKNSTQSEEQRLKISEKYKGNIFKHNPYFEKKGSFCSQYIISVYQATSVAIGSDIPLAMRANSRNTSVRTLDHFLKTKSGFKNIGVCIVQPDDVTYDD
ncbi:hypothetical protein [Yersinia aleksiciae]|uniref:hypothetical protein n=1 Tax=Yersinia aleksiciae TaxID=263819 RepID=UPI00119ED267|nr:hypothetical protein [Yersinia aleksiciae]